MRAKDIPESIRWHEGMLLTPQHFQQLTLRNEALLQYNAQMVAPFFWGVSKLSIDKPKLNEGILKVNELEAVMPDGLVVQHNSLVVQNDGSVERQLSINLQEQRKDLPSGPVLIHLAVQSKGVRTSPRDDDDGRYEKFDDDQVADEYSEGFKVQIPRLKPILKLVVNPLREVQVSFPLSKVELKEGTLKISEPEFIPPQLSINSEPQLFKMCTDVADNLRNKAIYLSNKVQGRVSGSGTRMRPDVETENIIRSLVSALPMFNDMLNTKVSHPYQVYLALCSIVGNVAVLGSNLIPPDLKPYNHNDLYFTFQQAIGFIKATLKELDNESYTAHPFKFADEFYYLRLESAWKNKQLAIGIRGQTWMEEIDVIKWGRECLIGTAKKMNSIRENRIIGAQREHVKRVGDLVPPKDIVLFSLKPDPVYIVPGEELQIFNRADRVNALRPAEIFLYVLGDA